MKIAYLILFIIAIVFCIICFFGHTSGLVAGALCFFAATMLVIGKRNLTNDKQEIGGGLIK